MVNKLITIAIYTQAFILGCTLAPLWVKFQQNFIYTAANTYIYSINTTAYPSIKIQKLLDKFNEIGDNIIVNYDGIRPIKIYDRDQAKLGFKTLGLADVRVQKCDIYLVKGLSEEDLYEVLTHEYLHCMFYDHLDNEGDLMCSDCILGLANDDNFKYYADDLKRKMYGEGKDLQ